MLQVGYHIELTIHAVQQTVTNLVSIIFFMYL
jgi:hypothetical protein